MIPFSCFDSVGNAHTSGYHIRLIQCLHYLVQPSCFILGVVIMATKYCPKMYPYIARILVGRSFDDEQNVSDKKKCKKTLPYTQMSVSKYFLVSK